MRTLSLLITITFFAFYQAVSQSGVAINTTGSSADPSAAFDVSSSTQGTLITRLTTTERDLINLPANGLMIYNTTTKCLEVYEYGIWQPIGCAVCPLPVAAGNITGASSVCEGDNGITYSVPIITNAINYVWNYSGIGATINGSSNTITIDFASNATSGNLTVKGNNQCGDGVVSNDFSITVFSIPSAPIAGSHSSAQTEITWDWNDVSGATGYQWNTINTYPGAGVNTILNSTFTQTNLSCETSYTLYVWAYNDCGVSNETSLTQITSTCPFICGSNLSVNHIAGNVAPVSKSVHYGTVLTSLGGTGNKCWITQNLGSDNQATAANDNTESASGWFWQFNRKQGYKHDGTTRTPNTTWNSSINETSDWLAANDPCTIELGTGWRIPTATEWTAADASWINYTNTFNSVIKLHAGGGMYGGGDLSSRGVYGVYWSSTQLNNSDGRLLDIGSGFSNMSSFTKAAGFLVRCLKD